MKTLGLILVIFGVGAGITMKDRIVQNSTNKNTQSTEVQFDPPTTCDNGLPDWNVTVDGDIVLSVCAGKNIEMDLDNRILSFYGDGIFKDGFDGETVVTPDEDFIIR